jgi:predicted anti-sigma-YlaC factor YlaD
METITRTCSLTLGAALMLGAPSCSVHQYAVDKSGDALAGTGSSFASDDDLDLVRDAAPFGLKLMESVLSESPSHRELLLALARGFTQYAYAYVQQDAEMLEASDLARAEALKLRARRLFLRAKEYGLRGLDAAHPGFARLLAHDARAAVQAADKADVAQLYWTAAAWGAAIALSKDVPDSVADQPIVEALIDRALELDERFDDGAIHTFLVGYESSRIGAAAGFEARARKHFDRAVELSNARSPAPFIALAESVCVQAQRREEFESLLRRALSIDPDAVPEHRLDTLVLQRRARWLLDRESELFLE